MTEHFNTNENQENNKPEFVREQIKDKPINRKKLQKKLLESGLCGLVFALAAVLVLFIASKIENHGNDNKSSEEADLTVVEETETEDTETENPEGTADSQENVVINNVTLTLDDYQKLQSEMYTIGEKANKSITAITSVVSSTDWFNNTYETENLGSGIIVAETDSEYLILTEKDSIPNKDKIYVTFRNDTTVEASLKASDSNTGIAVISVAKENVDAATKSEISVADISGSGYIRNGQLVIALGSPLGTPFSILTGTITSKNNEITRMDTNLGIYTTDVPGNKESSGVLIDVDGKVVGLIMQAYNTTESTSNLIAVPIAEVENIIELLMDGKQIPYMGLSLNMVTDKIASANNLPKGIYIREVAMDSPAMDAGLQSGDVITEMNGISVISIDSFYQSMLNLSPGTQVKITVQRQNGDSYSEVTCTVTLGTME